MNRFFNPIIVFLLAQIFFSCQKSAENYTSNSEKIAKEAKLDSNFVLEKIVELESLEAIAKQYGSENLLKDSLLNSKDSVSVLFPKTKNEVILYWVKNEKFNQVLSVVIHADSGIYKGNWHSKYGLQPGQTLQEIVALNQKEFTISGFDWEYGGHIVSWEGGHLDFKKLSGAFSDLGQVELSEQDKLSVKGDTEFNVSLPVIKKMNPILTELVVAAK